MPLDTIYLTRHGHRLNWTIDYKTGTYHSQFPTPTGNPADPTLTSHGVRQSHELAAHFVSADVSPKPFRVYSSPFYRCLQTIQPAVEGLSKLKLKLKLEGREKAWKGGIDEDADFGVRVESGLGEWFGPTTFFTHPSPASLSTLHKHFPSILPSPQPPKVQEILTPSPTGESIPQLHDRLATTLSQLLSDLDTEITALESSLPPHRRTSKAVLICSHAAPLIAMGRVLTGRMPDDPAEEDFAVFTAGVSTFVRRRQPSFDGAGVGVEVKYGPKDAGYGGTEAGHLAPGTRSMRESDGGELELVVPEWRGGRGVGGGWECVSNGDCGFLSQGRERGWHFNGEEDFDTGAMAGSGALPTSSLDTKAEVEVGVDGGSKL
ncbi:phosphoglycerate mutase family protein [Aspergillus heteromorphus CBS 117.55]|uniref:Phosphoglycerate mutase family protein n=1 Tax=Aspergillus heteromorphus CBS 117.55 TaxID=1448321 RepID=A0A317WUL6_9EURO|nr:phosphoglycerate mutase family protein [Aspergillus heteromorphus CBS 117.55]PWY90046.1 phosphoglycerate mutase family protein [Aspergillus heteromorphus CBS 117.55]